jgi:hypothetical protein
MLRWVAEQSKHKKIPNDSQTQYLKETITKTVEINQFQIAIVGGGAKKQQGKVLNFESFKLGGLVINIQSHSFQSYSKHQATARSH